MNGHSTGKRFWCIVIAAVGLALGAYACASAPPEAPTEAPVAPNALRVGVSTNAPPLIYKAGDKVTGLEHDLAVAFAQYLDRPLHVVELKWQDQIPALLEGRTDIIMSGMTITPKRAFQIDFAEPYLQSGQVALVRASDRERYAKGYADIAGQYQTIGSVRGTFGQEYVEKTFEDSRRMSFRNSQAASESLTGGIIDVLIHDGPIICMLAASNASDGLVPIFPPLTKEYLAWGIPKANSVLLQAANNFLADLKKKNQLKPMVKRWIPYEECTR